MFGTKDGRQKIESYIEIPGFKFQLNCVILNPPESPFENNDCTPKISGVQRGTSPEQGWLIGWKKSNNEARPPLIA